ENVGVSGQRLASEVESRDVEGVHDVVGDERYLGRLPDRQLKARVLGGKRAGGEQGWPGLRRLHEGDLLAGRVLVAEAPSPLEPRDLDPDGRVGSLGVDPV